MFILPITIIFIASLPFMFTFIRQIRVVQRWVWRILFCAIPMIFPFYCVLCFFIRYSCCHQTDQICSMTSLTNLVLTPDTLVRTLFALFCVLTSPLVMLVFWGLAFLHQQESSPKMVDSLNYFGAQSPDSPPKRQNHFYSYSLNLRSLCLNVFQVEQPW